MSLEGVAILAWVALFTAMAIAFRFRLRKLERRLEHLDRTVESLNRFQMEPSDDEETLQQLLALNESLLEDLAAGADELSAVGSRED